MRAKITYPVEAAFHMSDPWPIEVDGIAIETMVSDGKLTAINCSWALGPEDEPPHFLDPGEIVARGLHRNVDFRLERLAEVERLVRTVQGMLSLRGAITIGIDRGELECVPDDGEDDQLSISIRFNPYRPPDPKPTKLDFNVLLRAFLGAPLVGEIEVPLTFARRAMADLKEGRIIESFYNSFFSIETQFAGGFSDPKKVLKALLAEPLVTDALAALREGPLHRPYGFTTEGQFAQFEARIAFLRRPAEEVLRELVQLRGNLHHHAMRRPDSWHPEKAAPFLTAAQAAHDLAMAILMLRVDPLLDADELDQAHLASAEAAGAMVVLEFLARGRFGAGSRFAKAVRTTGTVIDRHGLMSADLYFRQRLVGEYGDAVVDSYEITDPLTGRSYGRYERHPFPPEITPTR